MTALRRAALAVGLAAWTVAALGVIRSCAGRSRRAYRSLTGGSRPSSGTRHARPRA